MTIPAGQVEAAGLLRRLAGRDAIETHISAVFVGADTVWKLRKAVRLAFLDFTALEQRHRMALRELALNTPHAPGLYRDVVAVVRLADGSVALDEDGEVLDWVLRMARVPAADFLDRMAEEGQLTPDLLDRTADIVAAMHASLPPVRRPQATAMQAIAVGNAEAARAAGMDQAAVATWLGRMQAVLAALGGWLERRSAAGMVRRAHGDLHLGNLCLWRGGPVPFDALEFSEDLGTIDLGYDLAFLLMDLEMRAGRAAANRVMNRYLACTGDWDLVAGLPAFLSMRAMIRAHVAASSGRDEDCRRYLARALDDLAPRPALAVAIGGLPGTGKSTLARSLAPELGRAPGAVVLRSDEIRKRQQGVAIAQRLPAAGYSAEASSAVFDEINRAAGAIQAAGQAVIADASFLDPATRRDFSAAVGGRFLGLWLDAPVAVLEARIRARHGDASDADVAVLHRLIAAGGGAGDWVAIDATEAPAAVDAARASLRNVAW